MFANGLGNRSSIPARVIPKTKKKKILLKAFLLNTHRRVRIKGKWSNGLVSLFNGISTFVGYLMSNLFS